LGRKIFPHLPDAFQEGGIAFAIDAIGNLEENQVSKLWTSLYEIYHTLHESCLKTVEEKSERLEELDVNRKGEGGSQHCEGVGVCWDTVELGALA
jgi:hypothetical protein